MAYYGNDASQGDEEYMQRIMSCERRACVLLGINQYEWDSIKAANSYLRHVSPTDRQRAIYRDVATLALRLRYADTPVASD